MTAAYQREYRRRRKEAGGRLTAPVAAEREAETLAAPEPPADPVAALAEWSRECLRIPPGHAREGEPLEVPPYFLAFLADALAPGVIESGCFVGRKNAKSAAVAVLCLAHLAEGGPLRRPGWRAGVASLSRDKAGELATQMADIARASGLKGIHFGKVPRHASSRWGRVEFLSADRSAGHASGFDLALIDELGLFPERGRALVAGMRSSVSARAGRLLAISVLGDSPLSAEMVKRRDNAETVVHLHQAPKGCALDDRDAWRAANPTLGSVKAVSYMEGAARLAAAEPGEQAAFRAYDLNQPGAPAAETIVTVSDWESVAGKPQPPREGRVYVGFDAGGSASMTAAALYWPSTGRLESFGAFGDTPDLAARGEADGVGGRYLRMQERGELQTFPGRVTPVAEFLEWIDRRLEGARPALALADRYRDDDALDALQAAGLGWPMEWRAQGAGKHGAADIRAFQRAVISGRLRPGESLLLESAILESKVTYPPPNANPVLDKSRSRGRIDALSAAILAVGAGERMGKGERPPVLHIPLDGGPIETLSVGG